MSKTGPKVRTRRNSQRPGVKSIWEGFVPPADFDTRAVAEYDRLRDVLRTRGVLETSDPRMVILAVRLFVLIEEATEELATAKTLTLTKPRGGAMPHPMITVITNASTRLRGILNDLGLSPRALRSSARPATAQADPKAASKWGGILDATG